MFNVGGGELLVILLIALMVLGPDRLPGFAKKAGKVLGDVRRISSGFQSEMRQAMDFTDDTSGSTRTSNPAAPATPRLVEPPAPGIAKPPNDSPPPRPQDAPASGPDQKGDDTASGTSAA